MKSSARTLLIAYDYVVFYLGLLWFGVICLTWTLFAVVMHPIMPRDAGRRLGRWGIMRGFRLFLKTLELSGRFQFDLTELDGLADEESLIIAPNHPSLWDAVLFASRLPNVACIMKAEIIGNIFLGAGARLARYIRNASLRQMITLAVADLQRGSHVLLFPEGTRTVRHPLNPLKGSIGVIAHRASVPVQTAFIETDSPFLTKGWPVYKMPSLPMIYRVRLGKRFEAPASSAALMSDLEKYFTEQLMDSRPVQPAQTVQLVQSAPAPVAASHDEALLADDAPYPSTHA